MVPPLEQVDVEVVCAGIQIDVEEPAAAAKEETG